MNAPTPKDPTLLSDAELSQLGRYAIREFKRSAADSVAPRWLKRMGWNMVDRGGDKPRRRWRMTMTDRYPAGSVLEPQWTRVEDGLPTDEEEVTFVVRNPHGLPCSVHHGSFILWAYSQGRGWSFVARHRRWMSSEQDHPEFGTVTHWSPRVGIPLPEDE